MTKDRLYPFWVPLLWTCITLFLAGLAFDLRHEDNPAKYLILAIAILGIGNAARYWLFWFMESGDLKKARNG